MRAIYVNFGSKFVCLAFSLWLGLGDNVCSGKPARAYRKKREKRAEEKSRESHALLASLFDAVGDGIAYVETSGKIIAANKRLAEDMLGYKVDEIVGMNFEDLGSIEPKELSTVLKMMTEAVATDNPVKDFRMTLIRKDGRRINTEVNTSILKKRGRDPWNDSCH